ncbi:MAG: mandelate racemase/muconate lactonizing enzyme family protein, partial [Candidatus Berkelbacteria bacterium]|nr:mandelate racemase/muconate lactonizing enzyme family protein [Candidatus Berkelbacteria bacterium]
MKIKNMTAYPLKYPEPHDHGALRYITLARVEAEDGTVGWGEAISQFPDSSYATKIVIEHGYAPLLIGQDALEVERAWHIMLNRVWWYGPQGIAAFAISAIDMALWDLKGKLLDLPVCNLIGGKMQEKVIPMASIHFDMDDMQWTIDEFKWMADEGYQIVKGGWGTRPESVFGSNEALDIKLARSVRAAIGDDIGFVIDVLGAKVRWDLHTAIDRLKEMEPYNLLWIEEPLPPWDFEAHRRLRQKCKTRIGTGEQEWNLEGYRRLIAAGGVDVVQMDPGRCLGITGCSKVVRLVEAANLRFSAHTWSGALNTAAGVHLLSSSLAGWCMDFKPHESPMQHDLVNDPW